MSEPPLDYATARLVAHEDGGRTAQVDGEDVFEANARPSAPWPHSSADPTGTKTLRDRYAGEMYRRFRALKGAIREGVVENDAFGLARNPRANAAEGGPAQDLAAQAGPGINIDPPEPGAFDFPSDEDKVNAFRSWLDAQVDRGILERSRHEGRDLVADRAWQNTYIRSAYSKGATHADASLVEQGIIPPDQTLDEVFRATRHADAAGLLYTRAYEELDGVTSDMAQEMTRELTGGFTAGENPRKIARRLNDRVDKVGLHRGRMIARTETIRAHNEAALNRYEDMGSRIDGVTVLSEFTTAGDRRVCPRCIALEGKRLKPADARGVIPVHPNCRCTFLPIQPSEDEAEDMAETVGDDGLIQPDRPELSDSDLMRNVDSAIVDDDLGDGETSLAIRDALDESDAPVSGGSGWADLDPDRARMVAEAVDDLDRNGHLDRIREVDETIDVAVSRNLTRDEWDAMYNWDNKRVSVHPDRLGSGYWDDAVRSDHNVGDGINEAKNLVYHEFGHAAHHARMLERVRDDGVDLGARVSEWSFDGDMVVAGDTKAKVADEVSDYATTNGHEVVAEMFTGKVQGHTYPSDLDDLYETLAGPRVDGDGTISYTRGPSARFPETDSVDDAAQAANAEAPDDLVEWRAASARSTLDSFRKWYASDPLDA
ncbi:MuF-like protein [Halorubrum phage Hardycor1]|nr:MuF-like protein [Halorubrum phage Hardycor1]